MAKLGQKEEPVAVKSALKDKLATLKETEYSSIVAGIYGEDDTAKTGIALELLTQNDIEENKVVYVFDFDQSAVPLKKEFWDNLQNIVIINPTVFHESGKHIGETNSTATINNTMEFLLAIKLEDPKTIAGIIIDGLDVVLKTCEFHMKEEELKIDFKDRPKQSDWWIRDKKYNAIVNLAKSLGVPAIFITHTKDVKTYVKDDDGKSELQVTGSRIDWGDYTRGQMYQRLRATKVDTPNHIFWKVTIEKTKTNGALNGKEIVVMKKDKKEDKVEWLGFDWGMFSGNSDDNLGEEAK